MNIQIFGKGKCFDTKKAERYFKERNMKYQMIDMTQKGFSKGEFQSIRQAIGDLNLLIDDKSKEKDKLLLAYLSQEDQEEKLLENPKLFRTPIVRNGKKATVGYQPDVWSKWD